MTLSGSRPLCAISRKRIGVAALSGAQRVTRLAHRHGTSRKFVRAQRELARQADDLAFAEPTALSLIEPFPRVNDARVKQAAQRAGAINRAQGLSGVRVCLCDEIFQSNRPVLARGPATRVHAQPPCPTGRQDPQATVDGSGSRALARTAGLRASRGRLTLASKSRFKPFAIRPCRLKTAGLRGPLALACVTLKRSRLNHAKRNVSIRSRLLSSVPSPCPKVKPARDHQHSIRYLSPEQATGAGLKASPCRQCS